MKSDEHVATVRCSFMLPIHKSAIKEIDFTAEMKKNKSYTAILINEDNYINIEENRSRLLEVAQKTYEYRTKNMYGYEKFCCDFSALEERVLGYEAHKQELQNQKS